MTFPHDDHYRSANTMWARNLCCIVSGAYSQRRAELMPDMSITLASSAQPQLSLNIDVAVLLCAARSVSLTGSISHDRGCFYKLLTRLNEFNHSTHSTIDLTIHVASSCNTVVAVCIEHTL